MFSYRILDRFGLQVRYFVFLRTGGPLFRRTGGPLFRWHFVLLLQYLLKEKAHVLPWKLNPKNDLKIALVVHVSSHVSMQHIINHFLPRKSFRQIQLKPLKPIDIIWISSLLFGLHAETTNQTNKHTVIYFKNKYVCLSCPLFSYLCCVETSKCI